VPIPFAPLVGFLVGVALAWVARGELGRDDGPLVASRPMAIVSAFAVLVYTPIVGYFVTFHGDWAYLYLVSSHRIPSAIDLALVLVSGASVPLGTLLASPAARARRLNTIAWLGGIPAVLVAALFAWSARRLAWSATYAQFHGDFGTEPIASSALGRGVLWMAIVAALGLAFGVRCIGSRSDNPLRGR
jgi:hypothetical protein